MQQTTQQMPLSPDSNRQTSADDGDALAQRNDHFVRSDGVTFAGSHLLLDLWGARQLDDADFIEQTLRYAIIAAGAQLLHIHLHRFTQGGGISGVALLAESHISVHTWPERDFAAFDIFMCGTAQPEQAARVIKQAFAPQRSSTHRHRRGLINHD